MTQLSEVLGHELAAADVADVRRTASVFDDIGTTAASIRGRLLGLPSDSWQGAGADAFRRKQSGDIAPQLDIMSRSFGAAAHAVGVYAARTSDVLDRGRVLRDRLQQARDQHRAAAASEQATQAAVGRARQDVRRAAGSGDPGLHAAAQQRQGALERELVASSKRRAAVEAAIAGVHADAECLRAEHTGYAASCAAAVSDAAEAGMRNDILSWLDRHVVTALQDNVYVVDAIEEILGLAAAVVAAAGALLVLTPLAPLGGALLAVSAALGLASLGARAISLWVKHSDPLDARSDEERGNSLVYLGTGAIGALPFGRIPGVRHGLERFVSTPGKRIYITPSREAQIDLIGGTAPGAVVDGGTSIHENLRRQAQRDQVLVCTPMRSTPEVRGNHRHYVGPQEAGATP